MIASPALQLTLIVVNYNNRKWLNDCFRSINSQTLPSFRLIFVDDCSTDDSCVFFENYPWREGIEIDCVKTEQNNGVSHARNFGYSLVSSKYVTQIDSDDYFISDLKLEIELGLAMKDSNSIAFSEVVRVDSDGEPFCGQPKELIEQGDISLSLYSRNIMIPRDFTFSLERFNSVGGYDETINLYEDWDLKLRLALTCKFFFSGLAGIAYRRHGRGLSAVDGVRHKEAQARVMLKNLYTYSDKHGSAAVRKLISNREFGG